MDNSAPTQSGRDAPTDRGVGRSKSTDGGSPSGSGLGVLGRFIRRAMSGETDSTHHLDNSSASRSSTSRGGKKEEEGKRRKDKKMVEDVLLMSSPYAAPKKQPKKSRRNKKSDGADCRSRRNKSDVDSQVFWQRRESGQDERNGAPQDMDPQSVLRSLEMYSNVDSEKAKEYLRFAEKQRSSRHVLSSSKKSRSVRNSLPGVITIPIGPSEVTVSIPEAA